MNNLDQDLTNNNMTKEKQMKHKFRHKIYCEKCFKEFHRDTDIYSSGIYSHKLNKWFCSGYCYNHYCYDESIHAYDNPVYRSQFSHIFNDTQKNKLMK